MLPAAIAVLTSPVGTKFLNQGLGIVVKESWRQVSKYYASKCGGDEEVARLSEELELKLRVIQTPLDLCSKQFASGNQGMEGARDVAVAILTEIDKLQQDTVDQQIKEGRGEPTLSAAEWAKKLKRLSARLDALVPYLGLAVATSNMKEVTTIDSGGPNLSRLMWASGLIQKSRTKCGKGGQLEIMRLHEGVWLQKKNNNWRTEFLNCSIAVAIKEAPSSKTGSSTFCFDLMAEETSDCSDSEGNDENSGVVMLDVALIHSISWSTAQELNLGEGDMSPVLTLAVLPEHKPSAHSALAPNGASNRAGLLEYGIQCRLDNNEDDATKSTLGMVTKEWQLLGEMEYILRLACLEMRSGQCHTRLPDADIRKEFEAKSGPTEKDVATLQEGVENIKV